MSTKQTVASKSKKVQPKEPKSVPAKPVASKTKQPRPEKYVPKRFMVSIERTTRAKVAQPRTLPNGELERPLVTSTPGLVERLKAAGYEWASHQLALGTQAALEHVVEYLGTNGLAGFLQVVSPGHAIAEYTRVAAAIKDNPTVQSQLHYSMVHNQVPGKEGAEGQTGVESGLAFLRNQFAASESPAPLQSEPRVSATSANFSGISSNPISTGVTLRGFNPVSRAINTPFGPGIELMVQMPLCLVSSSAGGAIVLSAYGTTTINAGGNGIEIGPDAFGDRLASFAALYTRWKPVHVKFKYTSNCPTTTAGSVVIAVSSDPGATVSSNIASLMQLTPGALCPVWSPETDVGTYTDNSDEWYYTDANTSGSNNRLENCGEVFLALSGATPSTNLGILWCCFRIVLAGPCPNNGITAAAHIVRSRSNAYEVFEKLLNENAWDKVCELLDVPNPVTIWDKDPSDIGPCKLPPAAIPYNKNK